MSLTSLANGIPWLWHDYGTSKFGSFRWLPSLLLLAAVYGIGCLIAVVAGDLFMFIRDLRWFGPIGVITLSSLLLSYVPLRMERLWTAIEPWLANEPEVVNVARNHTRRLLTLFFPLTTAIWAAAMVPFAVIAPDASRELVARLPRSICLSLAERSDGTSGWVLCRCCDISRSLRTQRICQPHVANPRP
jgi:hypothetical protein